MSASVSDVWRMSAVELAALFDRAAISPVEVLDAFFERYSRLNPMLNAIVATDEKAAYAAARASEGRMLRRSRLGALDGVPITIKDNIFVRELNATWGSLLFRDFRPQYDDIAVTRLRDAGAVIAGKTNTPEFALAAHTDNHLFGATKSPWDLRLTPGGSSGGAAAAVAAGMGPLGLGTDAVGELRASITDAFQSSEVLLTPTSAAQAWALDSSYLKEIDGRDAGPRAAAVFATFVNATGLPAISLPATPAASGLSLEVQLVGGFGVDKQLLSLAARYEAANPWHNRWPQIALHAP